MYTPLDEVRLTPTPLLVRLLLIIFVFLLDPETETPAILWFLISESPTVTSLEFLIFIP